MSVPEEHDKGYRLLFSFPRMVEDLIRLLIGGPWIDDLDFTTLEKVPERSVGSPQMGGRSFRREKDLVWRLKYDSGTDGFYLYLHFEFQARPEKMMAVRSLIYKGLHLEDLARRRGFTSSGKLPPILSIVVYTGKSRWQAARSLQDLVEPMPGDAPSGFDLLSYELIDEARFSVETLDAPASPLVGLLKLEQSADLDALIEEANRLGAQLQDPEDKSLREAFAVLVNESLLPQLLPNQRLPPVHDLLEVPSMLAESALEWREGWFREGREEGLRSGRKLLGNLLEKRFGALTTAQKKYLSVATAKQLDTWGDRLLEARSPEEVFDPEGA